MQAGVESYGVDYRARRSTYNLPAASATPSGSPGTMSAIRAARARRTSSGFLTEAWPTKPKLRLSAWVLYPTRQVTQPETRRALGAPD